MKRTSLSLLKVLRGAVRYLALAATLGAVGSTAWAADDARIGSAKITFSGYKGSTSLSYFPALVRLSASKFSDITLSKFASGGSDIRFYDSAGNEIPHEIEKWDASGESLIWVRVPTLTGTGTYVTMKWGATSDRTTQNQQVWNSLYKSGTSDKTVGEYAGVWHMNELGNQTDRSGHDYTLTGTAAKMLEDTSWVGKGVKLNGSGLTGENFVTKSRVPGTVDGSYTKPTAFTLSAWFSCADITRENGVELITWMQWTSNKDCPGFVWKLVGGGSEFQALFGMKPDSSATSNRYLGIKPTPPQTANPHHIAISYDLNASPQVVLYFDGVKNGIGSPTLYCTDTQSFTVKNQSGMRYDEMRVRRTAVSADWAKADYDTQNPSTTFFTASNVTNPKTSVAKPTLSAASGAYTSKDQKSKVSPSSAQTGYTYAWTGDWTNVGNHSVTATLSNGYCWADGTTGVITLSYSITKAANTVAQPSLSKTIWAYGEEPATVTAGTPAWGTASVAYYSDAGCTKPMAAPTQTTAVGTYYVRSEVPVGSNWDAAQSAAVPFTITGQAETVPKPTLDVLSYVYDGNDHRPNIAATEAYGVEYTTGAWRDVGEYEVACNLKTGGGVMYKWEDGTTTPFVQTVTVTRATNAWTVMPVASPRSWEHGDGTLPTLANGTPKFGTSRCDTSVAELRGQSVGVHAVRFTVDGNANYTGLTNEVLVAICDAVTVPAGYQRVAYVQATNGTVAAYVDTGLAAGANVLADVTFAYQSPGCLLGTTAEQLVKVADGRFAYTVGGASGADGAAAANVKHQVVSRLQGTSFGMAVNGADAVDATVGAQSAGSSFYLFASHGTAAELPALAKIYAVRLANGSSLTSFTGSLVPIYCAASQSYGFYDGVRNQFCYSATANALTGPKVVIDEPAIIATAPYAAGKNRKPSFDETYYTTSYAPAGDWIDVGSYTITLTLKDKVNTTWPDGTTDNQVIPFEIINGTVAVPPPLLDDYAHGYDGANHRPTVTVEPAGAYTVSYQTEAGVATDAWTEVGKYKAVCQLTEGYTWEDGMRTDIVLPYVVTAAGSQTEGFATMIVSGYDGSSVLTNFPLRLNYSGEQFPGLNREKLDTSSFVIKDAYGQELDYDVAECVDNSDSYCFWVKLPRLAGRRTRLSMTWQGTQGSHTATDDYKVWKDDYAAVWHFSSTNAVSGQFCAPDATGHGLNSTPFAYSVNRPNGLKDAYGAQDGLAYIVGSALTFADYYVAGQAYTAPSDRFTVSGWYFWPEGVSGYPATVLAKEAAGAGWKFVLTDSAHMALHLNGSGTAVATFEVPDGLANWQYVSFSYDGSTYAVYVNGERVASGAANIAAGTAALTVGPGTGMADETRVMKSVQTPDWARADYLTQKNYSFTEVTVEYNVGYYVWDGLSPVDKKWSTSENWMPYGVPGKTAEASLTANDCVLFLKDYSDVVLDGDRWVYCMQIGNYAGQGVRFSGSGTLTEKGSATALDKYTSLMKSRSWLEVVDGAKVVIYPTGSYAHALSANAAIRALRGGKVEVSGKGISISDNGGFSAKATGEGSSIMLNAFSSAYGTTADSQNSDVAFGAHDRGQLTVGSTFTFKSSQAVNFYAMNGGQLSCSSMTMGTDSNNPAVPVIVATDGGTMTLKQIYHGWKSSSWNNMKNAVVALTNGTLTVSNGINLGSAYAAYVTLAGDAPNLNGSAAATTLGANTTFTLVPTREWSADTARVRTTGAITLSTAAHFVIDYSALADWYGEKTVKVISGGSGTIAVPGSTYVSEVNNDGTYSASFSLSGKTLSLTLKHWSGRHIYLGYEDNGSLTVNFGLADGPGILYAAYANEDKGKTTTGWTLAKVGEIARGTYTTTYALPSGWGTTVKAVRFFFSKSDAAGDPIVAPINTWSDCHVYAAPPTEPTWNDYYWGYRRGGGTGMGNAWNSYSYWYKTSDGTEKKESYPNAADARVCLTESVGSIINLSPDKTVDHWQVGRIVSSGAGEIRWGGLDYNAAAVNCLMVGVPSGTFTAGTVNFTLAGSETGTAKFRVGPSATLHLTDVNAVDNTSYPTPTGWERQFVVFNPSGSAGATLFAGRRTVKDCCPSVTRLGWFEGGKVGEAVTVKVSDGCSFVFGSTARSGVAGALNLQLGLADVDSAANTAGLMSFAGEFHVNDGSTLAVTTGGKKVGRWPLIRAKEILDGADLVANGTVDGQLCPYESAGKIYTLRRETTATDDTIYLEIAYASAVYTWNGGAAGAWASDATWTVNPANTPMGKWPNEPTYARAVVPTAATIALDGPYAVTNLTLAADGVTLTGGALAVTDPTGLFTVNGQALTLDNCALTLGRFTDFTGSFNVNLALTGERKPADGALLNLTGDVTLSSFAGGASLTLDASGLSNVSDQPYPLVAATGALNVGSFTADSITPPNKYSVALIETVDNVLYVTFSKDDEPVAPPTVTPTSANWLVSGAVQRPTVDPAVPTGYAYDWGAGDWTALGTYTLTVKLDAGYYWANTEPHDKADKTYTYHIVDRTIAVGSEYQKDAAYMLPLMFGTTAYTGDLDLWVVYGLTDGGDVTVQPSAWTTREKAATIPQGTTSFTYTLPNGWGGTVKCARFYFTPKDGTFVVTQTETYVAKEPYDPGTTDHYYWPSSTETETNWRTKGFWLDAQGKVRSDKAPHHAQDIAHFDMNSGKTAHVNLCDGNASDRFGIYRVVSRGDVVARCSIPAEEGWTGGWLPVRNANTDAPFWIVESGHVTFDNVLVRAYATSGGSVAYDESATAALEIQGNSAVTCRAVNPSHAAPSANVYVQFCPTNTTGGSFAAVGGAETRFGWLTGGQADVTETLAVTNARIDFMSTGKSSSLTGPIALNVKLGAYNDSTTAKAPINFAHAFSAVAGSTLAVDASEKGEGVYPVLVATTLNVPDALLTGATVTAPAGDWTAYLVRNGNEIDVVVAPHITSANVTVGGPYEYAGKAITCGVKVEVAGQTLKEGVDYDVTGATATGAGSHDLTITAKGNYGGTVYTTWSIAKAPLTLKAKDDTVAYLEAPPVYTVVALGLKGADTVEGLGLTLPTPTCGYAQGNDAGAYPITFSYAAKTLANYAVTTESGTLTVAPRQIVRSMVTASFVSQKATGDKHNAPTVTVKDGHTTLTKGTHYTTTGEGEAGSQTQVGTYAVIVEGTGNYAGTVSVAWSLVKVDGTDWYVSTTGSDDNDGNAPAKPFATFAKAVAAADAGNRIHIEVGTYPVETLQILGMANIRVIGETAGFGAAADPAQVVLQTTTLKGPAVTAQATGISIENVTFAGGGAAKARADAQAVQLLHGTLKNCIIRDFYASSNTVAGLSPLTLVGQDALAVNCVITNNRTFRRAGGGVTVTDGQLRDSTVVHNQALDANASVYENDSLWGGGGAVLLGDGAVVSNCVFRGNKAGPNKECVRQLRDKASADKLTNHGVGAGGGLLICANNAKVYNTVFDGNWAFAQGGGVAGKADGATHGDVYNSLFVGNTAKEADGAAFGARFHNCTCVSNVTDWGEGGFAGATTTAANCLADGNLGRNTATAVTNRSDGVTVLSAANGHNAGSGVTGAGNLNLTNAYFRGDAAGGYAGRYAMTYRSEAAFGGAWDNSMSGRCYLDGTPMAANHATTHKVAMGCYPVPLIPLQAPTVTQELTYTGVMQTAPIDPAPDGAGYPGYHYTPSYTATGNTGTTPATRTAEVTLDSAYEWADGTAARTRSVSWTILDHYVIVAEGGLTPKVNWAWADNVAKAKGKEPGPAAQALMSSANDTKLLTYWEAYALGFTAVQAPTAAPTVQPVQGGKANELTIRLGDWPATKPGDSGVTVLYQLMDNLEVGGSATSGEPKADPEFTINLSNWGSEKVHYYRIKPVFQNK